MEGTPRHVADSGLPVHEMDGKDFARLLHNARSRAIAAALLRQQRKELRMARQVVRDMTDTIGSLTADRIVLKRELESAVRERHIAVNTEQLGRVSAQRGLVPYVRGVEALNKWLSKHPALRRQLEPILREQGLWDVKLGYDPDKDITLSVISPEHSAWRR
jgi:hypothetical protein